MPDAWGLRFVQSSGKLFEAAFEHGILPPPCYPGGRAAPLTSKLVPAPQQALCLALLASPNSLHPANYEAIAVAAALLAADKPSGLAARKGPAPRPAFQLTAIATSSPAAAAAAAASQPGQWPCGQRTAAEAGSRPAPATAAGVEPQVHPKYAALLEAGRQRSVRMPPGGAPEVEAVAWLQQQQVGQAGGGQQPSRKGLVLPQQQGQHSAAGWDTAGSAAEEEYPSLPTAAAPATAGQDVPPPTATPQAPLPEAQPDDEPVQQPGVAAQQKKGRCFVPTLLRMLSGKKSPPAEVRVASRCKSEPGRPGRNLVMLSALSTEAVVAGGMHACTDAGAGRAGE